MTTERKRPDGRAVWSWWQRIPFRFARWLYNFFVGPFLTKHEDGTVTASWTALFAIWRLIPVQDVNGALGFVPLGWPEVFLFLVTLYVKPINDALNAYAKRSPEKLIDTLLSRMGVGDVAGGGFNPFTGPANDGAPGGDLGG